MRIVFSAKTDTGRVRKENQDSYGISEGKNIYFLCDGMGGGAAGDFASRCAVEVMLKAFEILNRDDIDRVVEFSGGKFSYELLLMVAAIRLANRALSNLAGEYPKLYGMGTTLTSVYFEPVRNILHIFHVGDSRVYRLRSGVLELLTKDHSKVNELVEQGKMKEEEVKTAEIQSMITRALGTAQKVKVDYRPEYVKDEDYFLLCTDGLNGEIDDSEIKSIISANRADLDVMTSKLIGAANRAGGRDNTTVIALKAHDEKGEMYPYDSRPGKVITFEEETPEETKNEDRTLKKIFSSARIDIPKSAQKRSFMENPLVLGMLLAMLVALLGFYTTKCSTERVSTNTQLITLAGKFSGLKVEIREPTPELCQIFRKSDDTVAKL